MRGNAVMANFRVTGRLMNGNANERHKNPSFSSGSGDRGKTSTRTTGDDAL